MLAVTSITFFFCGWCEVWFIWTKQKQQSKCFTWTEFGPKNVLRPNWSDVGPILTMLWTDSVCTSCWPRGHVSSAKDVLSCWLQICQEPCPPAYHVNGHTHLHILWMDIVMIWWSHNVIDELWLRKKVRLTGLEIVINELAQHRNAQVYCFMYSSVLFADNVFRLSL